MSANELKLDLNFGAAEARIDAIVQRLERATQAAVQLQQAINNGGGAPVSGNGAAAASGANGYHPGMNGQGAASMAAGLTGSVSMGAPGGTTPAQQQVQAQVQGAQSSVAAYQTFLKQYPGLSASAYSAVAQQLGVTVGQPAAAPASGVGAAAVAGAAQPGAAAIAPTAQIAQPAQPGGAGFGLLPFLSQPVNLPGAGAMRAAFGQMFPSKFFGYPGVPIFAAAELSNVAGSMAGEFMAVQRAQNQIVQQQFGGQFVFPGSGALLTQAAGIQGRYNTVRSLTGQDLPLVGGLMQYLFRGVDAGFERDIAGAKGRADAIPLMAQLRSYGITPPVGMNDQQLADWMAVGRVQAGIGSSLIPFGAAAVNAVAGAPNLANLIKSQGANVPQEAAAAIARYASNPFMAGIRREVMAGRDMGYLAGGALPAMAAAGDMDAIAALRGYVGESDLSYYRNAAAGILDLQGGVAVAAFGAQSGAAGLRTRMLQGLRAGSAGGARAFAAQQGAIGASISAIDAEMAAIARLPYGTQMPQYRELAVRRAQSVLEQQGVGNEYTDALLSQSAGEYAVTAGRIGVQATYAGLYDATGRDVARVGARQGVAIDSRVRELQRIRDEARRAGRLDYGTDLAIGAEITGLQQQRVTIPAGVASRQLQLTESAYGVTGAQAGAAVTAAGLYGNNTELAQAFDALGKQIAGKIAAITDRLQDKNLPIDARRQAQEEVATLQGQQQAVRAQAATAIVGRSALLYGSTAAAMQTGVTRATLYGTDAQVSAAFGATGSALSVRERELDAQIANPNVPFDVRQRLIAEREGVRQQALQTQAASSATAIGRIETRATTAQGATANALHAAAVVGRAGQVGAAASGHVAALHNEAAQLNARLSAGGLSFEQEQGVRQRLNAIQRETFDTIQGAVDTGFHKQDLSGYGLAAMRQENLERRLRAMPYAPGNVMAAQMQGIGLRNRRVGQLRAREAALAASGNLSPERRYDIEREIEGSITANYEAFADMTTGAENRLGALSSRMPAGFRTFNGSARAAVFYARGGVPYLSSGFAGAAHERAVERLFGDAIPYPRSPMANLNPAGTSGGGDTTGILLQILAELKQQNGRGKGSFPHPARGAADMPPSGGYQRTGANTPFN